MATATICSIKRKPTIEKTMEYQLVKQGYNRFPESAVYKSPYREPSGRYRTGLDPEADYIKNLPEDEQKVEKERVRTWRLELQKKMGFNDPTNLEDTYGLGPFAPYYTNMVREYGSSTVCPIARLEGNMVVFNLENPDHLIKYAFLRVHPEVAPSWTHYDKGLVRNKAAIQFYVNDPEKEDEIAFNEKKSLNEAIRILEELNPEQRIRIARLVGIPVVDNSPQMTVYNLLDTFIKQGTIGKGDNKGRNSVTIFLGFAKMKKDNLILKDLIKQAYDHSILRKSGGFIYKGEQQLGRTEEDIFALLSSKDGQDWVIAIREELKAKKSISQAI